MKATGLPCGWQFTWIVTLRHVRGDAIFIQELSPCVVCAEELPFAVGSARHAKCFSGVSFSWPSPLKAARGQDCCRHRSGRCRSTNHSGLWIDLGTGIGRGARCRGALCKERRRERHDREQNYKLNPGSFVGCHLQLSCRLAQSFMASFGAGRSAETTRIPLVEC